MTETGRPYGGANDPSEDDGLPGERPVQEQVTSDSSQSPRAAQRDMSRDVTRVPDGDEADPGEPAKRPGIADATGPQG